MKFFEIILSLGNKNFKYSSEKSDDPECRIRRIYNNIFIDYIIIVVLVL